MRGIKRELSHCSSVRQRPARVVAVTGRLVGQRSFDVNLFGAAAVPRTAD